MFSNWNAQILQNISSLDTSFSRLQKLINSAVIETYIEWEILKYFPNQISEHLNIYKSKVTECTKMLFFMYFW